TLNFDFELDAETSGFTKNKDGEWVNYPLGIFDEFRKKKIELAGVDILYYGNIPNGAGLSSSASIELVTAIALDNLYKAGLNRLEMVKMSQSAENNFVGMNCGIMDQFAVGFGEIQKAIFLNCDTLEYSAVPVELGEYKLLIANTNKRRGLTDSKYNERRSECDQAVNLISGIRKIDHLSQLSIEDLPLLEKTILDPVIFKRARHIINENNRVLEAVNVLHNGDLIKFGALMNESHDSLKDDYDVTGIELDTLVYEARKIDGVIGSRMTGAGFGGCTVSLVKNTEVDSFIETLGLKYKEITGLSADFYKPLIGDGARVL
ncbi:MAG: galactokinase, partial [Bacteroidales bacterium]|nr:galactokinase [Bacteroidales bacterium]